MEIKRDRYLNKLIAKKNNGLIKVITGIRRSGKSYLLFELYYKYLLSIGITENHIIRIPLDDIEFEKYCDAYKLYEYIKSRISDLTQQYYVFIDEAQYAITKEEMRNPDVPIRLYGVLNSLLRKNNVDVYITGSNSKFLSTDIMTEFRGRGDEIRISPLAFSEFYPACGKEKADAWQEYLYFGGLPHILSEADYEAKSNYLSRLHREIYMRDLCDRYDILDRTGMESLMKVISSAIGSLSNPQKIADTFKSSGEKVISMPTISNYLKYLEESFLVSKVERYDIKGRKYISTPFKYYYMDLGLRNALLNFRQFEEPHLMENAIYNELIYRGFNVDVGVVEYFPNVEGKTTRVQLEVDFVINRGNLRYYIQSAFAINSEEKKEQERNSLKRIDDSFKKIIIVRDNIVPRYDEYGIYYIGIRDFLLMDDFLEA